MQIIRDEEFRIEEPTAVCIGKFDGVHLGHKKLLNMIIDKKKDGLTPTVFTFNPSPEELFTGKSVKNLLSDEEKYALFERMGIGIVIEYPLNLVNAAIDPIDFVELILVKGMNMKYIAAGSDISFGKGGRGNRELIVKLSKKFGFDCDIINKVRVDGEIVSSTRIRHAIAEGHTDVADRMLGRIEG